MDPTTRLLTMGAAGVTGAAQQTYVEDVFSTWIYDGTGATNTITNGIDLSGKGGLVWVKSRTATGDHQFVDTVRGATKVLVSSSTAAEYVASTGLTAFTSNGFTLGTEANYNIGGGPIYTSWTFRKQAKFFDVVTYTGTGVNRTVNHSLGSVPGTIIVKRTDTTGDWQVYHRSLANTEYLVLNTTAAKATGTTRWNSTTATSTEFSLGTDATVNANGGTYVAYLFAHDTSADGLIQCGSYTSTGGTSTISLGWEPQWLLIKTAGGVVDWEVVDMTRSFGASTNNSIINPNTTTDENSGALYFTPTATGFNELARYNPSQQIVYIAIRRGPMQTPTDATKVFQPVVYTGTNVDNRLVNTGIVTDMVWARERNSTTVVGMVVGDRMRGQPYLLTGDTAAEVNDVDSFDQQLVSGTEYGNAFSSMTGFWVGNDATSRLNVNTTVSNHIALAFRRAKGFFDIVAYTGTGVARTVDHGLGVVPELIIVKRTTSATIGNWTVYSAGLGATKYLLLNTSDAPGTSSAVWNNTAPTSSVFTVGTVSNVNTSPSTYIAYLFASCPGVSKVGSYTGTGTTKDIDCGFTNGARFVLIKRTDTTGDWYVYDTARGVVTGNDPYLLLNSTAAEATATDYIDPLSSGFQLSSTAPVGLNANGGTYIYLAIA